MDWRKGLGEQIANARRKAGMTQDQLHKAVGVSRNTIGLYERGETPLPFEILASIANAVSAKEFVVDTLHVTFSRNGGKPVPEPQPQQLWLDFDKDGGVTGRIEPVAARLIIKAVSALST